MLFHQFKKNVFKLSRTEHLKILHQKNKFETVKPLCLFRNKSVINLAFLNLCFFIT